MRIAIENNITFCDSTYLTLAYKLKTPIASEDKYIINSAQKYGIKVVRLHELINTIKDISNDHHPHD